MSKDSDLIGEAGESAVRTALLRTIKSNNFPKYPKFLFKPIFLGEKAELFDYLVYLRDLSGNLTGAHFFVQVKATNVRVKKKRCPAKFEAGEVKNALLFKVPSYLCAVKIGATSRVYIEGLSHNRAKGFSTISTVQNLNDPAVRLAVYDEVTRYFGKRTYKFTSAL